MDLIDEIKEAYKNNGVTSAHRKAIGEMRDEYAKEKQELAEKYMKRELEIIKNDKLWI